MKFTPGPWIAHKLPKTDWLPGRWEIHYSKDGECVAEIVHEDADARLIAAAPDMYEALKKADFAIMQVPAVSEGVSSLLVEAAAFISEALRKAEGEVEN